MLVMMMTLMVMLLIASVSRMGRGAHVDLVSPLSEFHLVYFARVMIGRYWFERTRSPDCYFPSLLLLALEKKKARLMKLQNVQYLWIDVSAAAAAAVATNAAGARGAQCKWPELQK